MTVKGIFNFLIWLHLDTTMKTSAVALILALVGAASAFSPALVAFSRPGSVVASSSSRLFSDPKSDDSEEGGLDLNLEEMFDIFDAADKGQNFDNTIKKVKKDGK